jgi:hypothetical protein
MPPVLTLEDVTNGSATDTVLSGQGSMGDSTSSITSTDSKHIDLCKFCSTVLGPSSLAPFYALITFIIVMCAEEKMVRSNATRIVTMMEHVQLIGDRAVCQLPYKTMRHATNVVASTLSIDSGFYEKSPIAKVIFLAGPVPTIISLLNVCPKTLGKWYT